MMVRGFSRDDSYWANDWCSELEKAVAEGK